MRKVMLLAAMLAMVLAAAAPAFAQATAVEYDNATDNSVNVEDSICTNVAQVAANQYSAGDQNAAATDGDATNIANTLGISVGQVNDCLNVEGGEFAKTVTASAGGKVVVEADDSASASASAASSGGGGTSGGGGGSASAASDSGGSASASAAGSASAASSGTLPETGGASVLALGAGVLLVAGGLVARRIVR